MLTVDSVLPLWVRGYLHEVQDVPNLVKSGAPCLAFIQLDLIVRYMFTVNER